MKLNIYCNGYTRDSHTSGLCRRTALPLNQTVKKQLLYTEERLQVAREEIAYLKAYAHLDTSFDEQSSSTIKSVAAQVNVIDDTHPTSAVHT